MWGYNSPGSSHPGVKWAATTAFLPTISQASRQMREADIQAMCDELLTTILRGALGLGLFAIGALAFVGYVRTHAIEAVLMIVVCLAGWAALAWNHGPEPSEW